MVSYLDNTVVKDATWVYLRIESVRLILHRCAVEFNIDAVVTYKPIYVACFSLTTMLGRYIFPISELYFSIYTAPDVSRNTAPRTPRAPRWNIVKTSRWWCFGFNWISRKISRKRRISEGENWRRGETSSYLPCTSTRSAVRAVYAVRCFVTSAPDHCTHVLKPVTPEVSWALYCAS